MIGYWNNLIKSLAQHQRGIRYHYDRSIRDTHGVSFPRSGRHWLSVLLELYRGGPVFSDLFRDENASITHGKSWIHEDDLTFTGKRVLYLYRNPLDVMFSLHTHYATHDSLIQETRHFGSDDPDVTHIEARLKGWMKRWTQHVIKWVFEPPPECKGRLLLTYEAMVADTEGSLAKAVEFTWRGEKAQLLRCKACVQAVTKELLILLHPNQPRITAIHKSNDRAAFINKYRSLIISCIDDKRIFELYPALEVKNE